MQPYYDDFLCKTLYATYSSKRNIFNRIIIKKSLTAVAAAADVFKKHLRIASRFDDGHCIDLHLLDAAIT